MSLLTTGITIKEAPAAQEATKEPSTEAERLMAADEDMARRMQAKLDAESMAGGRWVAGRREMAALAGSA